MAIHFFWEGGGGGGGGGGKEFFYIVPVVQSIVLSNHSDTCLSPHSLFQAPWCLEIHEKSDAKNALLQWYGHPAFWAFPFPKPEWSWLASLSYVPLAIWVRGRVTGEGFGSGDARITVTAPSKRSRSAVRRNSDLSPTHNCKVANRLIRISFSCRSNPLSPVMSDAGPFRLQNSRFFPSSFFKLV